MGLPSVISFFGKEQFESRRRCTVGSSRLQFSLATSIGVNTPYTGASIPSKFQHKVHLLLGGAEERKYHPSSQGQQDKTILFVGRLTRTKGVDDLIRAFELTLRKRSDARLVIVGDGPERANLIQTAAALGVSFEGQVHGHSDRAQP